MASPRQLKFIQNGEPMDLPNKGEIAITVRLGQKWQLAGTGEIVELWVCGNPHTGNCPVIATPAEGGEIALCKSPGPARVLGWWAGPFADIPPRLLSIGTPNTRVGKGLVEAMRSAYGEAFTEDAEVTVLIFERL